MVLEFISKYFTIKTKSLDEFIETILKENGTTVEASVNCSPKAWPKSAKTRKFGRLGQFEYSIIYKSSSKTGRPIVYPEKVDEVFQSEHDFVDAMDRGKNALKCYILADNELKKIKERLPHISTQILDPQGKIFDKQKYMRMYEDAKRYIEPQQVYRKLGGHLGNIIAKVLADDVNEMNQSSSKGQWTVGLHEGEYYGRGGLIKSFDWDTLYYNPFGSSIEIRYFKLKKGKGSKRPKRGPLLLAMYHNDYHGYIEITMFNEKIFDAVSAKALEIEKKYPEHYPRGIKLKKGSPISSPDSILSPITKITGELYQKISGYLDDFRRICFCKV